MSRTVNRKLLCMSLRIAALRLSFVALLVGLLLPCGASAVVVAAVGAGCEFSSLPDVISRIRQRTLVVDEVHLLTSYVSPPIETRESRGRLLDVDWNLSKTSMSAHLILYPVLVQILLTIGVYIKLRAAKNRAISEWTVDETRRALYEDAWPESVRKINNNIRNQFEAPVLFYVLALMLFALNAVGAVSLALAWIFVSSRIVHVYVHVGSNKIPPRRRAFLIGCIMILALAISVLDTLLRT